MVSWGQIYTESAEAKIPAVLDYLGTVIEVRSISESVGMRTVLSLVRH